MQLAMLPVAQLRAAKSSLRARGFANDVDALIGDHDA
jgi:hypothetical protein